MRRTRRIELTNDELYFSNGPQCGTLVVEVATVVDDEGPDFRRADVTGIDLAIRIGPTWISCREKVAELTIDWLATPGNLRLLAERIEWIEQRDPTRLVDRQADFHSRRFG